MTVKLPARSASVSDKGPSARQYHRQTSQLQRAAVDTHQRLATTFEKLAPRKMLCAVLLRRLSVVSARKVPLGGRGSRQAESGGQFSAVSGQPKCSPGIPARPPFAHTKPRSGTRSPVAQPFRDPIITKQISPRHRHRAGARWSQHGLQPVSSTAFKPPTPKASH